MEKCSNFAEDIEEALSSPWDTEDEEDTHEEINGEIKEGFILEHFQYEQEDDDEEEVAEEVEEQSIASEKENFSYSSFSEESENHDCLEGHD